MMHLQREERFINWKKVLQYLPNFDVKLFRDSLWWHVTPARPDNVLDVKVLLPRAPSSNLMSCQTIDLYSVIFRVNLKFLCVGDT
jgi:hypothetical protein